MPARRATSNTLDAKRLVEAITDNQTELLARFEGKLDDVIRHVDQIKSSLSQDIRLVQQDVRLEGHERKALAVEISHVANQLAEVRDSISVQKTVEARAVAKVAVQEAVPAVKKLSRPQWFAVVSIALMLLATVAEKAPPTLRFVQATLTAWAGADQ
jgi:prophage DNA circulation protein